MADHDQARTWRERALEIRGEVAVLTALLDAWEASGGRGRHLMKVSAAEGDHPLT